MLLSASGGEKNICVKLPTLTRGRLIGPEGGPAAAETGQTSRVTASGARSFHEAPPCVSDLRRDQSIFF